MGWPWDSKDDGCGYPFDGTKTPPSGHSTALLKVPTNQLKRWLQKARDNGGVYQPWGWHRDFTVAQLTAELRTREPAK